MSLLYSEFIENIISTRGQWGLSSDCYYEVHHILPKCMGGLPKRAGKRCTHPNIIWLLPQEHFLAHKLLAEENPTNFKLAAAFWRLCAKKDTSIVVTAEEYTLARELHATALRKRLSGSNSHFYGKTNQYCLGKTWQLSEQAKLNHSLAMRGKRHSELTKQKISQSKKGKPGLRGRKPTNEEIEKANKTKFERHVNWKKIYCVELAQEFPSIKVAAAYINISACSISNCLNGRKKTAGGYHWLYINKDSKE